TARANLRAIPLRWQRIAVLLRFLFHPFRCELSGTVFRPGLAVACVFSRRWCGLYGMQANTEWVCGGGVRAWLERCFAREALEGERSYTESTVMRWRGFHLITGAQTI